MSVNKDSQKVPNLRFKGFTDDWEQRKLNTIYKKIRNAFVGTATPYYVKEGNFYLESNNIKDGNINRNTEVFINDEFYEKQKDKWLQTEDIVMVQSGHVGHTAVIPKELNNTAAHALIMFQERKRETNPYFLNYQFLTNTSKRKLDMITTGNTIKHILASEMKNFEVFVCESAEENLISEFFRKLDTTITLHQRKLDQLNQLKAALLQQMFPGKGETVPKLRFAGFEGDWEERKLSSGLSEYTDRVIVEDDKEYYQISVRNNFGGITLRGSKMGNKIGRKRQAKINLTKYPQTLIFTRQTVEQGGIGWVDKYCDGAIVTENMPTISLDTSVFSKHFLTSLFQTGIFYKNAILDNIDGGSAQIAIHESKFLSSTLLFPNLDEQEKIGSFFQYLDGTITLHQRKLDQLQNMKQVLLQNMFI